MAEKLTTKEKKPLLIRLAPEMVKELKHLAIDRDTSINALTEEAILDLLMKYR